MATAINAELHNDDLMIVQATLTSNGGGANVTTTHSYKGFIVQVEIDPDDTDTPTDDWDLVISDTYASIATLSDNDTTSNAAVVKYQDDLHNGIACFGPLTLTGSNMGSGKTAVITLYIVRIM